MAAVAFGASDDIALGMDTVSNARRSRYKPKARKPIAILTDRDYLWFERLHRHGPLSSAYLLAYSDALGMAENRARDRLTQLYHEVDTPDAGRYLDHPWQQRATPFKNQSRMYTLQPAAKRALRRSGRWHTFAPGGPVGMWFQHEVMAAALTSSIELAVSKAPGSTFIFHDEICDRMGGHLAFDVDGKLLKPDRAFGIRNSDGVLIYLVEVDRATETNGIYLGKLDLYRQLIEQRLFRDSLKIQGGVVLINLMSNETHMRNVMKKVSPNIYMLFKALPVFDREFQAPPVMPQLFTDPWLRVSGAPHCIMQ